jgi:hypothetical protein
MANNAETLVPFNTEEFDTDNAYDATTNYRFTVPSGKAGKYCFQVHARASGWTANRENVGFRKNGTAFIGYENGNGSPYDTMGNSILLDLAVSDYIDVVFYHQQGSAQDILAESYFSGFKLI